MSLVLKGIEIDNFKSYYKRQSVRFSDLSVLLGANSSGKSTALQALLAIKQTMECNSPDEELLLSGQYVALGDFADVISSTDRQIFTFKTLLGKTDISENDQGEDVHTISWSFEKGEDGTSAVLRELNIDYENMSIIMKRNSNTLHNMYINKERSPYSVKINNLLFAEYYLHYDVELNKKAVDFVNQMMKRVIKTKVASYSANEPFSLSGIDEFYLKLLGHLQSLKFKNKQVDETVRKAADSIVKTLNDFCNLQLPVQETLRNMPNDLRQQIMMLILNECSSLSQINSLVGDFKDYLDNYRQQHRLIDDYSGLYSMGGHLFVQPFSKDEEQNDTLTQLKYALKFYNDFHNEIIKTIFFVGPIREKPKGLYNVGFERIPKYVGPTGSYFASVLLHENKKEREYILPTGIEKCTLSDALAEWMMHLNIASAVDVDKTNSFGFSVSIENMQRVKSDIMNVGIGTSQVLPVLISVLLSEPGEILMFEQPELHLHPYSQSRLADLFAAYCKEGRKVIVETHSEYFLLRMRYHIVKDDYSKDKVEVNFFLNKDGTHVETANISGFGNIEYPMDFRDETQELLDSILKAALERKGLS